MILVFRRMAAQASTNNNFTLFVFVTADVNFPSVDLANLDATGMFTDLMNLKCEVRQLREEKDAEKTVLENIQSSLNDEKGKRC